MRLAPFNETIYDDGQPTLAECIEPAVQPMLSRNRALHVIDSAMFPSTGDRRLAKDLPQDLTMSASAENAVEIRFNVHQYDR